MEGAFEQGTAPGAPPAGFWIRAVAALIDSCVFWLVELVLRLSARAVWGAAVVDADEFSMIIGAFMVVVASAYYIVLHATLGQTIGKMVVGVTVVRLDGRPLTPGSSVARYAGYFVSAAILMLGYVMAGVRADKRALHDVLAGTRVVRDGRMAAGAADAPRAAAIPGAEDGAVEARDRTLVRSTGSGAPVARRAAA
jgi:uncharacterized RDD family membrane protein YckC